MGASQFGLFRSRKFVPLFVTMFLGAFNDNFFKSAMVILITYGLTDVSAKTSAMLVTAAAGLFILPFFVFSAIAGQLADKYERSKLVSRIKLVEILVMGGAVVGFYSRSAPLLMTVLFLMGSQSAFFGPLKYSILPQQLERSELVGANGLIETGTFLAILLGTIFGGLAILTEHGLAMVSVLVVAIAAVGWLASLLIPKTIPVNPGLKVGFNIPKETFQVINRVRPRRTVFVSVLAKSWFYLVGGIFLALFPSYAKDVIGADEQVATLFLGVFSVGIAAGALGCNGLLKGRISGRYVAPAAVLMAVSTILLYFFSLHYDVPTGRLTTAGEFLSSPASYALLALLFLISLFGGLYLVPLSAIIQSSTSGEDMAGVISASNITDSFFMAAASAVTVGLIKAEISIPQIFLVIAALTVADGLAIRKRIGSVDNI